ncbi:MAG: hypothetical protein Q9201_004837 [Fulgogasparrea decipioides]
MLSSSRIRWSISSLFSILPLSFALHLPFAPARLTSPFNHATGPPISPTRPYPIPYTHPPLVLSLQTHYPLHRPVPLSRTATIHMLISAKAQLDREITEQGSAHDIGYGRVVIEDGVQIFFNSGPDFTIGDGSAALRGILTMIATGLLETKEMVLDLTEGEHDKFLGSLQISKYVSGKGIGASRTRLESKI